MSQERIWDHFQNEGVASFADAAPRYDFLAKRIANSLARGSRVLNIGAGSGALELMLRRLGFAVSSLDPCERTIERLRHEGVDGHVGLAEALPFDAHAFDAVVASEVLEHLDAAQCDLALSEIGRVLELNGLFIGTVPFNEKLEDSRAVCPECGHKFHRWGHQQAFTRERLAQLLSARFQLVALSTGSFVRWNGGLSRLVKSAAKWALGKMGEQIAAPHLFFECRNRARQ